MFRNSKEKEMKGNALIDFNEMLNYSKWISLFNRAIPKGLSSTKCTM